MGKREIKFRGFDPLKKEWVYGNLIQKIRPDSVDDIHWCYLIQDRAISTTIVQDESVGQYTGLKDKNGKEAYEGDVFILKKDVPIYRKVIYNDCRFIAVCINEHYDDLPFGSWLKHQYEELEIIGNIYENPELLNN